MHIYASYRCKSAPECACMIRVPLCVCFCCVTGPGVNFPDVVWLGIKEHIHPLSKGWMCFWKRYISQIAILPGCQSFGVFTSTTTKPAAPHTPNHICCSSALLRRQSKAWCMSVIGKASVCVNGVDIYLNGSWLCCCMSSARRLLRLILKQ